MYEIALKPRNLYEHWRALASYWQISSKAKARLEWMIFYYSQAQENALLTAKYFGISPKTFHKWKKRFDPHRIQSLEEKRRTPHHKRVWEVTPIQETRIIKMRNQYLKYGKQKLKVIYQQDYSESISAWKIERVIRKHHFYPDPAENQKRLKNQKRKVLKPKRRIGDLKNGYSGTLWHTDSIVIWWYGQRRIIFTALEDKTKLGYARVYPSSTSRKAADFLKRLVYLSDGEIQIIHSDNGGEFAGGFKRACQELSIEQVYSGVRQPKDNPALERFNWTVQDEWLSLSEVGLDNITEANLDLTDWLIEYNSHRPHQALDYLTPLAYATKQQVLPCCFKSMNPYFT